MSVAEKSRLQATRITQGKTTMYLTTLQAKDLVGGMTAVDSWSPTNKSGYQRMPVQTRFKKIARYVMGKDGGRAILPQAVVLNVREEDGKLKFLENEGSDNGVLEISPDQKMWEVDGQHRLGGLRFAIAENPDYGKYTIPVVITEGLPRLEEAVLFYVINTTQKRVPTDLAQRLIEQQMGDEDLKLQIYAEKKEWIPKGTKIVDVLVQESGHPWHGKIGIPGTKIAGVLMKQVSFVTSLKPLLTGFYGALDPEEVAQLLIRYWQAIEAVSPEAFKDPSDYVIQKTVGVFPLHMIAQAVFDLVRTEHGKISKDGIEKILRELNDNLSRRYEPGSEFWHRTDGEAGKYAGAKGFSQIAGILREHLPAMKKLKFV